MTSDRRYLVARVGEAAVGEAYRDGFTALCLGEKTQILARSGAGVR